MVLAGLGTPASAATTARHIPAPQLKIKHFGEPGLYGQVLLTLSVRCFGGALVEELAVDITQGEVSGRDVGDWGQIVCDGIRRDVFVGPYSNNGADFVAGSAKVTARLTVLDPKTMKPLPEAVSTHRVYLRPFVTVKIAPGPVRLNGNGSVVVRASIKCLAGYEVSDFSVSASQNDGSIYGNGSGDEENPPCDGTFHEHTFTVTAKQRFVPGKILVTADGYIFDPDTYDPVDADSIDRTRRALPWGY